MSYIPSSHFAFAYGLGICGCEEIRHLSIIYKTKEADHMDYLLGKLSSS